MSSSKLGKQNLMHNISHTFIPHKLEIILQLGSNFAIDYPEKDLPINKIIGGIK